MAKLKMLCVSIAVLNKDRKKLISKLQKCGVMELKKSRLEVEAAKDADSAADLDANVAQNTAQSMFARQDHTASRLVFERMSKTARQALDILDSVAPKSGGMLDFLNGRREIGADEYRDLSEKVKPVCEICYDIAALDRQLGECRAEIARLNVAIDRQMSWSALDVPTGFKGTKTTRAFVGSLAAECSEGEITEGIAAAGFAGEYALEIVQKRPMQTDIFALCLKSDAEPFDAALRKIGFSYISDADAENVPLEAANRLTVRRDALRDDCEIIKKLIASFADQREQIEFLVDYYSMRAERYRVYGELLSSENVTLIEGYIPANIAADFAEAAERDFAAAVELREPSEEDEPPVALKNNAFAKPCENTVVMFSPPGRRDVDPTPSMAFFFYLFFGMMLSDAGYGLLFVLGTLFVLKKFRLEEPMRNTMRMFLYCGISTIFWGILFGGFFGDLIPKIAEVYFGKTITMPKLLDPINDALTLLVIGLALGAVHIFTGMAIHFYNFCRQGQVIDAIFDVGLWFVTIIGMICAVAGMFTEIGMLSRIGLITLGVGIAGLVLTQGRKKKGLGKIVSGIASIYDITGYASDILSYCRLMALGLATGVFAQVINQLGMNRGIFGFITFIIIFIVGNLISFAMNALGAYVHTIRLQYVEYFGKFYEGGGRMFEPFAAKTEFIRLTDSPAAPKQGENSADRGE